MASGAYRRYKTSLLIFLMLFRIHIDINDHRIGEQCVVFLGGFQHREPLLWTHSCYKTRQLRHAHGSCNNPANISAVSSPLDSFCSGVCVWMFLSVFLPADIWLLSASNFHVSFGKHLALKLSLVSVCFHWLHCVVKVFPWAATHLKWSLWKPWG